MSGAQALTAIDICLCTFRRPHVTETLASLERLRLPPGVAVSVIVADNDVTPSARAAVERFAATSSLRVTYAHCPAANISVARNGCLDRCAGEFAAFLDDDELASEGWLDQLLRTARATGADVVLGPVEVHYGATAPRWMRTRQVHATRPVWVEGEIRTGYTCNVLFRRAAPPLGLLRFDRRFGQTGGEDSDFFHRAWRSGARFAYAPGAILSEDVPESRATFGWLVRRRFRMGHTHGTILAREAGAAARLRETALAAAKACYCLGAALATLPSPGARNATALRGVLHLGTMSGLLGRRGPRHYGQAETAPLTTDARE